MQIIGLIIGLGAVTVIDIHGLLGRKSKYWTAATISAHKITKPLIWLGMLTLTAGHTLEMLLNSQIHLLKILLISIMVINGGFLSFCVSPKLLKIENDKKTHLIDRSTQQKIAISFVISFISWWSITYLTIHPLVN